MGASWIWAERGREGLPELLEMRLLGDEAQVNISRSDATRLRSSAFDASSDFVRSTDAEPSIVRAAISAAPSSSSREWRRGSTSSGGMPFRWATPPDRQG